jgi:phenylpyruvate tautomerase PptA (4-oxalocrotonate tautomerase family)
MPVVTLTLRRSAAPQVKALVLDAVHAALVNSGVNPHDLFQRVYELNEENFHFDHSFPDVKTRRTDDFALVEILLGSGRSVKVKKQMLSDITSQLSAAGYDNENLMVVFQDIPWENWSPAGGRLPHG